MNTTAYETREETDDTSEVATEKRSTSSEEEAEEEKKEEEEEVLAAEAAAAAASICVCVSLSCQLIGTLATRVQGSREIPNQPRRPGRQLPACSCD